jgi:hypothetical protein
MKFGLLVLSIACMSIETVHARPQEPYSSVMAQIYANQWVDNTFQLRNPAYVYYGSDCTNFVSQALRAGGWRNTAIGSQTSDLYWYYVSPSQVSYTWRVADSLYRRFSNGYEGWFGTSVTNPSSLRARVGDIIFADWEGITTNLRVIDHAMIVTGIATNGEPLVSYHSTDRENFPWSSLLAEVTRQGLKPTYYKFSPVNF